MTCNTVTNLGTLDMVHFIRRRNKRLKKKTPHRWFSLGPVVELKVTETHGSQGGWVKHLF